MKYTMYKNKDTEEYEAIENNPKNATYCFKISMPKDNDFLNVSYIPNSKITTFPSGITLSINKSRIVEMCKKMETFPVLKPSRKALERDGNLFSKDEMLKRLGITTTLAASAYRCAYMLLLTLEKERA